ncbi:MAG TPA: hypothetical protein GX726_06155 [Clostridiales bacterium]|jgi:hypothetical protein|nr:hypothetical protein [Clostridiales bacterium]
MKRSAHPAFIFLLTALLCTILLSGCRQEPTAETVIKNRLQAVIKAAQATTALPNGEIKASRSTIHQFDDETHTLSNQSTVLFEWKGKELDIQQTIVYKADDEEVATHKFRRINGKYAVKHPAGWSATQRPPGEDGELGDEWLADNSRNLPFGASILWDATRMYDDIEGATQYIRSIESTKTGGNTVYKVNYRPYDTNTDGQPDSESYIVFTVNKDGLIIKAEFYEQVTQYPGNNSTFTKTVRYLSELTRYDDPAITIDRD